MTIYWKPLRPTVFAVIYIIANGTQIRLPAGELENLPLQDKVEITPEIIELFERHPWPGNIRQLLNVIRSTFYTTAESADITRAELDQFD